MSRKYFLLKCNPEVDILIHEPLLQTERVKFTCFDVSDNYVVFGASSGSTYIYLRNPLKFMSIIPAKLGAIAKVGISHDETLLAVATNRGIVILMDNCFSNANVNQHPYHEHENRVITAMRWKNTDLYCGDNDGKVSVISHMSRLPRTIFQTIASIMYLDSAIVQVDAFSKYILISTRSKAYLCDNEEEVYRQVGSRSRDGDYGACFYSPDGLDMSYARRQNRKAFGFTPLGEEEKFCVTKDVKEIKILCARPGMRVWEADFDGEVIRTYQNKTMENVSSEIISIYGEKDIKPPVVEPCVGLMSVCTNKFLVSWTTDVLTIFQLPEVKLIFCCGHYENIREVKIVDNYIYIWNIKRLEVLAIVDIEMLVLKSLERKQYSFCGKLLKDYKDVLESSENGDLSQLVVLKEKLRRKEITKELAETLEKLRVLGNNKKSMVKVTIAKNPPKDVLNPSTERTVKCFNDKREFLISSITEINKQFQLNKLYEHEIPKLTELLLSRTLEEVIAILEEFIEMNGCVDEVKLWCYKQYLKQAMKRSKNISVLKLTTNPTVIKYLCKSLIFINTDEILKTCTCGYPLPKASNKRPEFYEIAVQLLHSKTEREHLLNHIPYLQKTLIQSKSTNESDISNESIKSDSTRSSQSIDLPLLIQFSETDTLDVLSEEFSFDQWEDAIRLYIKLRRAVCLNCERADIDVTGVLTWTEFATGMLGSLGPTDTHTLLEKYADSIPKGELDADFYRSSILGAVIGDTRRSINFVKQCDTAQSKQLEANLMNFLSKQAKGRTFDGTQGTSKIEKKLCGVCNLPLYNVILEAGATFECGHGFHSLCLSTTTCPRCDS